jgi:uncharacterized protein (DUF169 family)
MSPITLEQIHEYAQCISSTLELSGHIAGVRLLKPGAEPPSDGIQLKQHRYCQALMKARRGQSVTLDGAGINCPAAAAAFGFRPLPEGLRNGSGLVGFGIVSNAKTGERMFAEMPVMQPGEIHSLHIFPLDQAEAQPDVIVIEDAVEKLMWVDLAYLNAMGGKRLNSSTAILQATCVDSTIIPYQEKRLNFGYGCYGCREATDLGTSESVVGFPVELLPAIAENLAYLAQKAIPNSRSKRALAALQRQDDEGKVLYP